MGFIDWHGTKEDHFEDVLEYARDRQKEELRVREEKVIRRWIGEKLGDSRYAQLKSADTVKLLAREYMALDRIYADLCRSAGNREDRADPAQLWKDLWIFSIGNVTDRAGISGRKKETFMAAFSEKVFRLNYPVSMQQHLQELQNNGRYFRYFREGFDLEEDLKMRFWRWLSSLGPGGSRSFGSFLEGYQRCLLYMAFYLYLLSEESGEWIFQIERELGVLADLRNLLLRKPFSGQEIRKLVNPLYGQNAGQEFQKLCRARKVLLFWFGGNDSGALVGRRPGAQHSSGIKRNSGYREEEDRMVEELYAAIDDGILSMETITSILPEQMSEQIRKGTLPDFPKPDVQGLAAEEKLFYLNHTVLFQGKEKDGEIVFHSFKGSLYFTDRKIMFRGNGSVDFLYDQIDRIIEYDVLPEMLEIICNGKSGFFQVPDIETAYQVLKMIANRNRGKSVPEEKMPFTYEELVNKADLGACVFAFDYAMAQDMPEELREQLRELNRKLGGLQKTINRCPERKEEIYQFLNYYIPEAIRVVTAYQRYQGTGLE